MNQATTDQPINAGFLGGPPQVFDHVGREQLAVLLDFGLIPTSTVCDFGCGCLRGGKWIIPLIDEGNYCGIEPMEHMVQRGIDEFLTPQMNELKKPRFSHNDQFDCAPFAPTKFSHFIARSVWTHACKRQIAQMLDSVARFGTEDCAFLTSYRPARPFRNEDYTGDTWVGRSHESADPGMIRHSLAAIRQLCAQRGLKAENVRSRKVVNGQPWCLVTRA